MMRTQSAATKLLDHIDGWQKLYADDIATIPSLPGSGGTRPSSFFPISLFT
jgi:hypothetical protein